MKSVIIVFLVMFNCSLAWEEKGHMIIEKVAEKLLEKRDSK